MTLKQRRFVDLYLGEARGNGAKAAVMAGYSEHTARQIARENLTKPDIRAEIDLRLAESAMEAAEVLARLTEIARGTMEDFIRFDLNYPVLDLNQARERGKLGLIKSAKPTRYGLEIEIHDAQAALRDLAKCHGLFLDRSEVNESGEITVRVVYEDVDPTAPASRAATDQERGPSI